MGFPYTFPITFDGGTLMVTFNGTITKTDLSPVSNMVVSIVIIKPDTTIATVNATSNATGAFTTVYDAIPGTYTAKATTVENTTYLEGSSNVVSFTVGKSPLVITLNVLA